MQTTMTNKAKNNTNGAGTHRMIGTLAGTEARIELRQVTPELARKWLGLNSHTNRKLSARTVEAYAREMSAGRWQTTHQAIAFNQTGELIDGQHRLHAVAKSGVTIKAYISTGLPLEYNAPIDQGYGRRIDQIMGKSSRYVSVVRALHFLEQADLGCSFKTQVGLIEELADRHGGAVEQVMNKAANGMRTPAAFLSVCAFGFPVNPEAVLAFVTQVSQGEMLAKGDPSYTLRRWFQRADKRSAKENIIASATALKYHLSGKPIERLSAGRGDEREGLAGYLWLCQRRRVLKLAGTPSAESASFKAMALASREEAA